MDNSPEMIRYKARRATEEGLTPLEDQFVWELLMNPRITQGEAVSRAGSTSQNPSTTASLMLSRPRVQAALQSRRADLQVLLGLDALDAARKLKELAEADVPDIFQADGTLLPMDQWPPGARSAVSSITFDNPVLSEDARGEVSTKPRIKAVKFVDKLKVWEMLIKLVGIQAPEQGVGSGGGDTTVQVLQIGDMKISF